MDEQDIRQTALTTAEYAKTLTISNEKDYLKAADFLKQVKASANAVKDFFKDMKAQAAAAHKAICDKEKSYISPLGEADRRVRGIMSDYTMQQERIRREKEAELRRRQEEEASRTTEEAAKLESQGKKEEAEAALDMAVQIEQLHPVVETVLPKVEGISYQASYDVEIVNENEVPIRFMGAVLRPVDVATVKRLAKAAKGKIQIPGVRIFETRIPKVRA